MNSGTLEGAIASIVGMFFRIGTCMVVVPGFSSTRIPIRIRLIIAFGLSVMLMPNMEVLGRGWTTVTFVAEMAIGLAIGLTCRIYLAALEFVAVLISNLIGLSALSVGLERDDLSPSLTMLVTASATYVLIELGIHAWMLDKIMLSYSVFPAGDALVPAGLIDMLIKKLRDAFMVCLQIGLPFVLYSLLANIAFGVLGKLIPQVQTFSYRFHFWLSAAWCWRHLHCR